jgi:hypothetical protein
MQLSLAVQDLVGDDMYDPLMGTKLLAAWAAVASAGLERPYSVDSLSVVQGSGVDV